MKVTVDPDRCQGHAQCWDLCPEVFSLDEEGHSANCPERAITVS